MDNLTKDQDKAIKDIRAQVEREHPKAEVKAFNVTRIPDTEATGGMAIVRVELGFPGDEADYRAQLRGSCVYIVSARGRVETWNAWRMFSAPAPNGRKLTLHTRQAARTGRA